MGLRCNELQSRELGPGISGRGKRPTQEDDVRERAKFREACNDKGRAGVQKDTCWWYARDDVRWGDRCPTRPTRWNCPRLAGRLWRRVLRARHRRMMERVLRDAIKAAETRKAVTHRSGVT